MNAPELQKADTAIAVSADVAARDKRFTNARATLAMHDYQLHALDCGHDRTEYLVQRWDRSCVLRDMDAVDGFIRRAIGA